VPDDDRRAAEVRQLLANANKMAQMLNGRFVADEDRVSRFISAKNEGGSGAEGSSTIPNRI
jgi:hypothetical protein